MIDFVGESCICPKSVFSEERGVCRGLLGEASCSPLGPLRHFGRGIYCNARILQFLGVMFICKLRNSDKCMCPLCRLFQKFNNGKTKMQLVSPI